MHYVSTLTVGIFWYIHKERLQSKLVKNSKWEEGPREVIKDMMMERMQAELRTKLRHQLKFNDMKGDLNEVWRGMENKLTMFE